MTDHIGEGGYQEGVQDPPSPLGDATDAELLVALDGVLADYVLANKHESVYPKHGANPIRALRQRMSELGVEMEKRGLRYSHEKARAAAKEIADAR